MMNIAAQETFDGLSYPMHVIITVGQPTKLVWGTTLQEPIATIRGQPMVHVLNTAYIDSAVYRLSPPLTHRMTLCNRYCLQHQRPWLRQRHHQPNRGNWSQHQHTIHQPRCTVLLLQRHQPHLTSATGSWGLHHHQV